MHIVYCCKNGSYFSRIMAAIHLNELPKNKIPTIKEILSLEKFGEEGLRKGFINYIGDDCYYNTIYTLADKNEFKLINKAVREYLKIFNVSDDNLILIRTPWETPLLTIGGFIHYIGFSKLGNIFIAFLIKRNYDKFVQKVNEILAQLD